MTTERTPGRIIDPAEEIVQLKHEADSFDDLDPWHSPFTPLRAYWAGLSPNERARVRETWASRRGRPEGARCDGHLLKECRGALSQEQFAEKCSLHVSTIQRGETGGRLTDNTYKKIVGTIRELSGRNVTVEDLKK